MTTAMIITGMSSAMPTAVMTESSEKTMSSRPIWTITLPKVAAFRPCLAVGRLVAFEGGMDLRRRLPEQEQAAADEDEVTAGELEAGDREERLRQADDPGDREQQQRCA